MRSKTLSIKQTSLNRQLSWLKEELNCSEQGLPPLIEALLNELGPLCSAGTQTAKPVILLLNGELGTGKTTFAKKLISGMINADKSQSVQVKVELGGSPTYPLVQTYHLESAVVHHMDLYRIKHQSELFDSGIENLIWSEEGKSLGSAFPKRKVVLIEWPSLWLEFYSEIKKKAGGLASGRVFEIQIQFSKFFPESQRDFSIIEVQ